MPYESDRKLRPAVPIFAVALSSQSGFRRSSETPPTPTVELVVAPQTVEVGKTTVAVAFHVTPLDLEVSIEYGNPFAPLGEACDSASGGSTPRAAAPTWIELTACSVGEGKIRLVAAGTGSVIAEVETTVLESDATGGQGSPRVQLSGVASSLKLGGSDNFSVQVVDMSINQRYELNTVPLNGQVVAFDKACKDKKKTEGIWGVIDYNRSYTMWGCKPLGTTIWSYLKLNGKTIAATSINQNRAQVTGPTPTPTNTPKPKPTPTNTPKPTPTNAPEPTPTPTNTPPEIYSGPSSVNYGECRTGRVGRYRASDDDGDSISWSLPNTSFETDRRDFEISSSGVLDFEYAPDYENPDDSNDDNVYKVTVRADDGEGREDDRNVTITVTNVNDAPTFTEGNSAIRAVAENTRMKTTIGAAVSASDEDGDTLSYSLGGTDSASFSIVASTGQLKTKAALDYETKNSYSVTVAVSDGNSGSDSIAVTINVTNVDEPGAVSLTTTTPTVGSKVTASLSDPDGGVTNLSWKWATSSNGGSTWVFIQGATQSGYTPQNADIGKLLRATAEYKDAQGSNKRADSLSYTVLAEKLAKPTGLDGVPMALRKALLTWTPSSNADSNTVYRIEIAAASNPNSWTTLPKKESDPTKGLVIELDNVVINTGLANEDYFDIRIAAEDKTQTHPKPKRPSDVSDAIRIIDNPILTSGRANGKSSSGNAQAKLEWDKVTGVQKYIVRYRELGKRPSLNPKGLGIGHSSRTWPGHADWPYYPETSSSLDVSQPSSATVSKTVGSLNMGELYAFQVNYVTTSGDKVFSARDAYAWPSDKLPTRFSRVGTYPFFGYWDDGEYEYTICEKTFTPATSRGDWENLIEHAFEQWERAAPDLLTVTRRYDGCLSSDSLVSPNDVPIDNNVPITVVRALYNESNEVYMVDTSNWNKPIALINDHNWLFHCIIPSSTPACVISPRYWDRTSVLNPFRVSVRALDDGSVDVLVSVRIREILPQNAGGTIDLSKHRKLDIPGNNTIVDPRDTRFNECQIGTNDVDFRNYRTMVHEAGHALGLSNFEYIGFWDDLTFHPTIPDSVMNYNSRVPQITNEPDCSPHPFDVMAVEALYQNLN